MKKKLMTFALVAMALFGFNAAAQTACEVPSCQQRVNPGDNNKMRQPRSFEEFAFEGILLDMNQQARIDSLNNALKQERQTSRKQRKECLDSIRANGNCQAGTSCPKTNPKQQYIAKVKEILNPDQYTTFLENIVFMQESQPQFNQQVRKGMNRENINPREKRKMR